MENVTILYVIDVKTTDDTVKEIATRVRDAKGYLRIVLYAPLPIRQVNATGGMSFAGADIVDSWPQEVARTQAGLEARGEALKAILADVTASGEITPVFCALADIKAHVAYGTRSADLVMMAANMRANPDVFLECAKACLFSSPVGLLLNTSVPVQGGHVFLAWDDGDAASNAVHKALPLLKSAHEVTIGCFDPVLSEGGEFADPGTDVAAWLTRHGCSVTLAHYPSGGVELGACILNKASELGCDLVVMGAYGRSKMRQTLFGGTTRTMLEQSERAVFLAH